jgi:Kef-type K+ transport system membrane component KefB
VFTAGLLLASGGEFAFVAFGEAVSKGVLPVALTSELYMVVALSMAMVPYLAALGGKLGVMFERSGGLWAVRALSHRTTTCTAWLVADQAA